MSGKEMRVRLENTFPNRRSRLENQCILNAKIQLYDDSRINVGLQIRRMGEHWADKACSIWL